MTFLLFDTQQSESNLNLTEIPFAGRPLSGAYHTTQPLSPAKAAEPFVTTLRRNLQSTATLSANKVRQQIKFNRSCVLMCVTL